MDDKVFSPSFGNRPSQLVGRDDIIASISSGLESPIGSRERAIVLIGQRGTGKTVLLWEIGDRARRLGYVVADPTTSSAGMLDRIVEKVQIDGERLETHGPASVSGATLGALGFSVGLQFTRETMETKTFYYKLRSLCKSLEGRGKGVLVLVDELQANTDDLRQLVSAYQELVGEGLNVAIVLAGLPASVSGTLNDRVLTFFNRATRIQLEPLSIAEIDTYYAQAFREQGVTIGFGLRRQASAATEGSPYLMQLIGHYLTRYAFEGTVDQEILDEALITARHDFERDVCQTTVASLSHRDVDFLKAMAEDAASSRTSIVAQRMGVSTDYAQKYRKRLIDAGIIVPAGRGEVSFAVPLLQEWLRQSQ